MTGGLTINDSLTLNLEDNSNNKHLTLNQGDAILNNSAIIISDTANGAPNKSFISFDKTNFTSWKIYNSTIGHLTIAAQSAGGSGYFDRIRLEGNSATSVLIIDNLKVNNTPQSDATTHIDAFYLPVFQVDNNDSAITTANPGILQVMKPALSSSWTNGTTQGPIYGLSLNGMSTSTTIPAANVTFKSNGNVNTTQSGVVTTTEQYFIGHKILISPLTIGKLTSIDGTTAGTFISTTGNMVLASSTTPTITLRTILTNSTNDVKLIGEGEAIKATPRLLIGESTSSYNVKPTYTTSKNYACVINNNNDNNSDRGLYVANQIDINGQITSFSNITSSGSAAYFRSYNGTTALYDVSYNYSATAIEALLGSGNIKGIVTLTTTGGNIVSLTGKYDSTHGHHIQTSVLVGTQIWGAVWNDYAEFRETKSPIEPGRCIIETGNGDLVLSTERLQNGAEIVSDTYGFAIGQTEKCNTPIASNGRVLAYLYEDTAIAKCNIGQPVCSGPNGTVSIMTNKEARDYPWKIIGTISEIPNYDKWQIGELENNQFIEVNNRIWIRIR